MKTGYLLITNNQDVKKAYENQFSVEYIEGTYLDVLLNARDKLHKNYKLATHPLSGSIKPNETPYKSVFVQKADNWDSESVNIIETSITTVEKFLKNRPLRDYPENILKDFRYVDQCLVKSAVESILG